MLIETSSNIICNFVLFSWYPLYQSDLVDTYQPAGMEEVPDDEDDSNDENNWRNDYPDEDDLQESRLAITYLM